MITTEAAPTDCLSTAAVIVTANLVAPTTVVVVVNTAEAAHRDSDSVVAVVTTAILVAPTTVAAFVICN